MKTNGKKRDRKSKLTFGAAVDRFDRYRLRDQGEQDALLKRCEEQAQRKLAWLRQRQNERRAVLYSRLDDETKKRVAEYVASCEVSDG